MTFDPNTLRVSFNNNFTDYYYTIDTWSTNTKITTSNILTQYIPQFQIDFNTEGSISSSFNKNIININSLTYPSIGYYLGYRSVNNSFLLTPSIPTLSNGTTLNGTNMILTATKNYNTAGEDYIFLKINDWGNFDIFNTIIFSKIFLRSDLTSNTTTSYVNKTNNYINKEYVFRQLTNISKLNIELVDYLGNTVDLNGVDFSFTLALRIQANVGQKQLIELQNSGYH
jgi:hypothetical protein